VVGGWWLVTHYFLTLYTGTCVSYLSSLALLKRVVQKTVASSTFSLSTDPQVLKNLLSGMRRVFLEQNGGGERTTVDLFNNVLKEVFAPVEEGKEDEGKEEEEKEDEGKEDEGKEDEGKEDEGKEEEEEEEGKEEKEAYSVLLSKELVFAFEQEKCVATVAAIHYAMLLHESLKGGSGYRGVLLVGPSGVGKR
jgi:hypothetical protein